MASSFLHRNWRILVVAGLGAVLAFVGSFLVDPTYTSETRVLIRGRDATFLSSTGDDLSAQPGVIDSSLAQSLAATYSGTATSRTVATSVVEDLGLDERPEKSGPIAAVAQALAWVYRCGRAFVTAGFCAPVDPYEDAVRRVQEGTAVEPVGVNAGGAAGTTGSYVLEVRGSGTTAEEARLVTDAVADELIRVSGERFTQEAAENVARLEGLVAEAEDDVAEKGAELARFQTDNGLLAQDGGQVLSAATYENLRADLLAAQAEVADLEGQLATITEALRTTPRTVTSNQSIVTGRSSTQMSTDAANSVYAELEVSRHSISSQLDGQRARVAELQSIVEGASALADNSVLAELATLENALRLAQGSLGEVTRTLQEARVTEVQSPVDLTRMDEAAAPLYPSEPKRYMYLALGLLIGALAGAALTARARRRDTATAATEGPDPDAEPGAALDLRPGVDDSLLADLPGAAAPARTRARVGTNGDAEAAVR